MQCGSHHLLLMTVLEGVEPESAGDARSSSSKHK
jgi:hypothetical protein